MYENWTPKGDQNEPKKAPKGDRPPKSGLLLELFGGPWVPQAPPRTAKGPKLHTPGVPVAWEARVMERT